MKSTLFHILILSHILLLAPIVFSQSQEYPCASNLPPHSISVLEKMVRGIVISPSSPSSFKNATNQWNAMYDGKVPFAVVYAQDEKDVISCVKFAR